MLPELKIAHALLRNALAHASKSGRASVRHSSPPRLPRTMLRPPRLSGAGSPTSYAQRCPNSRHSWT